jgi:hypothetical protein
VTSSPDHDHHLHVSAESQDRGSRGFTGKEDNRQCPLGANTTGRHRQQRANRLNQDRSFTCRSDLEDVTTATDRRNRPSKWKAKASSHLSHLVPSSRSTLREDCGLRPVEDRAVVFRCWVGRTDWRASRWLAATPSRTAESLSSASRSASATGSVPVFRGTPSQYRGR